MRQRLLVPVAVFLAAVLPACGQRDRNGGNGDEPGCGSHAHRVSTLKAEGGRVDWSHAHGRIAYDRPGADGFYDVYTMALDGSGDTCLTCGRPGLPQRHNGNPAWHPSGNFIVFQSEAEPTRTAFAGNPGRGVNNVLWVTDPSGAAFHRITELSATDEATGVLHPHFSRDGTRLSWSEMYAPAGLLQPGMLFGHWRLVIADFAVGGDGRPRLSNARRFDREPAFYENHGFSPGGTQLLFSSNVAHTGLLAAANNDIYLVDLGSLALTRLTRDGFNEHAHFFPGGRKILWMSNTGIASRGTDLWVMNPDGTDKERLTFMNEPGCAEYAGSRAVAADSTINAAGDKILVYVHDELLSNTGSIALVELERAF